MRVALLTGAVTLLCAMPSSVVGSERSVCRPQTAVASRGVELSTLGYIPANLEPDLPISKRHNRVGFVDDRTLAISFLAPPERPHLSTRQSHSSYRLHLVLLDIDSGKVKLSTVWPAALYESGVTVLAEGHLLLRQGEKLTLYSRDLKQLAVSTLEDISAELVRSISGKTLWSVVRDGAQHRFEAHSGIDLKQVASWPESNVPAGWSASDDTVVARFDNGQMQLQKKAPSGKWIKIFSDYGCYPGTPAYAGRDRIVFPSCRQLLFFDPMGRAVSREPLLRGERMDTQVEASQTGIAVISLRQRRRGARRLLVYNTIALAAAGAIPVTLAEGWHYAYAISPDGTRVAVWADGSLQLYEVSSLRCE